MSEKAEIVDKLLQPLETTNGKSVVDVLEQQRQNQTGMHDGYLVLSRAERAKGFVRPFRDMYTHTICGTKTHMGLSLSETYCRDPKFYSHTFCVRCNAHLPVEEFVWTVDGDVVGS